MVKRSLVMLLMVVMSLSSFVYANEPPGEDGFNEATFGNTACGGVITSIDMPSAVVAIVAQENVTTSATSIYLGNSGNGSMFGWHEKLKVGWQV